mgnify:FL=1
MKYLLMALAFAIFSVFTGSLHGAGNDVKIPMPNVHVKSIEFKNELGLFEVATENGNLFYMTKDRRYAIMGNVFALPAMENITEERKAEIFKIDFSSLPLSNAVKLSAGTKKIAVFSSPDCPWCRKLHEDMKLLKNVEVYVFLVPYGAPEKANAIWCSADKSATLEKLYTGAKIPTGTNSCDAASVISENGKLAKKLGLSGYPTIVIDDGRRISGYIPHQLLETKIFKKTAKRGQK